MLQDFFIRIRNTLGIAEEIGAMATVVRGEIGAIV